MKVRLLMDATGPNPDYNRKDPKSHHTIIRPAGTEIEHPDAWRLCCPESIMELTRKNGKLVPTGKWLKGRILAEPIDDEAKETLLLRRPKDAAHFGITAESLASPAQGFSTSEDATDETAAVTTPTEESEAE